MSKFSAARRIVRPVGAVAAAITIAGCSTDILTVDTPDVISESSIGGPLGATTLRNGAMQDFVVAFSGTQDGFVVATGNMGDEIQTTDTFADRYNTDMRVQNEVLGGALNTTYNGLQLARSGMGNAIELWAKAKPTASASAAVKDSLAEMYAIRGYAENFLAEAYCSGVPFSKVNADGSFAYGDPLTTTQILNIAGASMDSATGLAAGTTPKSLAAVGKARILLNLGQYAQAAAAVSGVATTFKYQVFHSAATNRQQNGIYNATYIAASRYTAGTNEGTNGLDYLTTPADPRVPWTANGHNGFDDAARRVPRQEKYIAFGTAVTLADGIEARLIEAEAALNSAGAGGSQSARDQMNTIINTLRSGGGVAGLTALASPTTQDAAINQLFRERAMWMYITGHRFGDMRRLIRQYGRAANTVFPIGNVAFRPGNTYGTDVTFIVPFTEKNNPKFTGCINRNP